MLISPSIFAADMTQMKEVVKELEKVKVDMLHIDIMDGHFVPNISFGPRMVKLLRPLTKIPFDVHLMISDPSKYLDNFISSGATYLTFHYEAVSNIEEIIKKIKEKGVKVGISIKPNTPVEVLFPYLNDLDLVLIMSVEPGFSGQSFKPEILPKVKALDEMKKQNRYQFLIEVDGGVNDENINLLEKSGCNMVVAGTYLFDHPNLSEAIDLLKGK